MHYRLLLFLTIGIHYVIFVSFILTTLCSYVFIPWFMSLTLTALIVRVIYSRDECPLTTYENHLRAKLDLLKSKGFLKDYILHPRKTFTYLLRGN